MKLSAVAASSFFSIAAILVPTAKADEAALFACVKKYTALGITPDTALAECKQKSLASCINNLLGKDLTIVSTTKIPATDNVPAGYLIDLGDDKESWMDGPEWRDRKCQPVVNGPSKTDRIGDPWNGMVKLEWFRQGSCPFSELDLGKTYSMEDAEEACKVKALKESL